MNSKPSSGETSQSSFGSIDSERGAQDGLDELRREFASLRDHVARFATQAGGEAAKSIRGAGQSVAARVGGAASGVTDASFDLMSTATEQTKTLAAEPEDMTRGNPLGTIAGAVVVGVGIGMMSRGRG